MKKGILLLLLTSAVFAHGQSLRDALYGGKLKNTPGTVIHKGEDLSSKMDTTAKVAMDDTTTKKVVPLTVETSSKGAPLPTDSTAVSPIEKKGTTADATKAAASISKEVAPVPKSNNVAWKEYIDSAISTLKTEVLPSKKIKAGTYYVTISYTIGTDGKTDIGDVFLSPENAYLQQQIKERLSLDNPSLSPVLSSTGTPHKVIRKYNFTLSKE